MSFEPAKTAAMVADILDAGPKAARYYWAGVVLSLLGVLWFASFPWLNWLAILLGNGFLLPGIGLVLKWRMALMRYQVLRDSWAEFFPEPPGEFEDTSEPICVGSNGTHDKV